MIRKTEYTKIKMDFVKYRKLISDIINEVKEIKLVIKNLRRDDKLSPLIDESFINLTIDRLENNIDKLNI